MIRAFHIGLAVFTILASIVGDHASAQMPRTAVSCFAPTDTIVPNNGAYLPPKGHIRGLVLFVQQQNDTLWDGTWERNCMPIWGQKFADSVHSYYNAMSHGELNVDLTVYPKLCIPPKPEDEYVWTGFDYGQEAKEILALIDSNVDYGEYDNYSVGPAPYSVRTGPDGQVDLIIVVHRSCAYARFFPFDGISDLGFWGDLMVDSNKHRIFGGTQEANNSGSSGVTFGRRQAVGMTTNLNWSWRVAIHEILHKIWGDAHLTDFYSGLGLMAAYSGGYGMSAYERHCFGYMKMKTLKLGVDTVVTLHDQLTTDDAIVMPIPGFTGAFYVFEFRGMLTEYDLVPVPGLYISLVSDNSTMTQKHIQPISADGKWQWRLDSTTGKPVKWYPDPLRGYGVFQFIPLNGNNYVADAGWGDSTAAFRPSQPWFRWCGNPSPDLMTGKDTLHTWLTMHVDSMSETSVTVSFSYNHSKILETETPPSSASTYLALYPNPVSSASGMLHGVVDSPSRNDLMITVSDALGRVVGSQTLAATAQRTYFNVPVQMLPSGWYSLSITNGSMRRSSTFFVTDHSMQ